MKKKPIIIGICIILAVVLTSLSAFSIGESAVPFSTTYTEGLYGYYTSTNPTIPKYRTWNGTTNSSESNAIAVDGNPEWVVVKAGTTRREKIMGVLTSTGVVNVQVYDVTSDLWFSSTNMTTAIGTTNDAYRGFDIAYETASGDALIVYNDNDATPSYRIWNGTAFETAGSLASDSCTGTPVWIVLASHPTTDEIIEVDLDTNGDTCAQVWNGTAWTDAKTVYTSDTTYAYKAIDVEYEQTSGDGIVVTQSTTDGQMLYCNYTSGTWCTTAANAGTATGGDLRWIDLAAMNGSDRIMMGMMEYGTSNFDTNAVEWSGTAWGTNGVIDTSADKGTDGGVAVSYIGSTGNCMLTYNDRNLDYPSYSTCSGAGCAAGTWTAGAQVTGATDCGETSDLDFVKLDSDPFTDNVMLIATSETTHYKCSGEYDGSSWGTWRPSMGSGLSLASGLDFDFAYDRFKDFAAPTVTLNNPAEANTTTNTSVTFNWTATDDYATLLECNLTIDAVVNASDIASYNGTPTTYTVSGFGYGAHNWSVTCWDEGYNTDTSETRNFTVQEAMPPNVTDVRPAAGSNYSTSDVIEVAANVTDTTAVDIVQANVTYPNGTVEQLNLTNLTTDKYNDSYTIPSLTGRYNVTFIANDTSNNVNDTATTWFNVSEAVAAVVSFTLTLPGESPVIANESQNGTTAVMFFNSSTSTNSNIDPCVKSTGTCQNSTVPFFVFENTGNVDLSWTINLNESLPLEITLQANDVYDGDTAVNITTTPYNLSDSVPPSNTSDSYFFADYVNAYPDNSTNRTLTHEGVNIET